MSKPTIEEQLMEKRRELLNVLGTVNHRAFDSSKKFGRVRQTLCNILDRKEVIGVRPLIVDAGRVRDAMSEHRQKRISQLIQDIKDLLREESQ